MSRPKFKVEKDYRTIKERQLVTIKSVKQRMMEDLFLYGKYAMPDSQGNYVDILEIDKMRMV